MIVGKKVACGKQKRQQHATPAKKLSLLPVMSAATHYSISQPSETPLDPREPPEITVVSQSLSPGLSLGQYKLLDYVVYYQAGLQD